LAVDEPNGEEMTDQKYSTAATGQAVDCHKHRMKQAVHRCYPPHPLPTERLPVVACRRPRRLGACSTRSPSYIRSVR
jgi:hypothetical protein